MRKRGCRRAEGCQKVRWDPSADRGAAKMTKISELKNNEQLWGDLTNVQKQQEVELKSLPVTEHRPPDR